MYLKKNSSFRYLLYVAESPKQSLVEYLYLGTFGETPKASRPIVIIYDVENLTFAAIETIPEHYSVGEITWKSDSSGIIQRSLLVSLNLFKNLMFSTFSVYTSQKFHKKVKFD